jgi:hypothetical protein
MTVKKPWHISSHTALSVLSLLCLLNNQLFLIISTHKVFVRTHILDNCVCLLALLVSQTLDTEQDVYFLK